MPYYKESTLIYPSLKLGNCCLETGAYVGRSKQRFDYEGNSKTTSQASNYINFSDGTALIVGVFIFVWLAWQLEEINARNLQFRQTWEGGDQSMAYGNPQNAHSHQAFFQPLECNPTLQIG